MNAENRYLFKLAWKNIRRNPGRSFFIGFSVALSVSIAVWVLALFDGMNHQIEEAVVLGNVGYTQAQEKEYASTTDPMSPAPFDVKNLPAVPYSPELVLDAFLTAPEGTAGFQVIGVQFPLHARAYGLDKAMVKGAWPSPGDRGIVIGQDTAEKFQLNPGDQMVLNFQDAKAELRTELVNVAGVYSKNGRSFERYFAYVDGDLVEEFLFGAADPRVLVHRVSFMGPNFLAAEAASLPLAGSTGLVHKTWKDLNPEMAVVIDFHDGMVRFFFLIVGLTVIVTILTPVSMLWQERHGELRMMSVIGVPPGKIWRMGFFEAISMGVLAGTASVLVLVAVLLWQGERGVGFESMTKEDQIERAGIVLPKVVYPRLRAHHPLVAYGFVLVVVGLSYGWAVSSVQRRLRRQA